MGCYARCTRRSGRARGARCDRPRRGGLGCDAGILTIPSPLRLARLVLLVGLFAVVSTGGGALAPARDAAAVDPPALVAAPAAAPVTAPVQEWARSYGAGND